MQGKPLQERQILPASAAALEIAGGFRAKKRLRSIICSTESLKILGGGLLSHMKICSIIGDKELNFRVRNGIGCTLFSMATKKFW